MDNVIPEVNKYTYSALHAFVLPCDSCVLAMVYILWLIAMRVENLLSYATIISYEMYVLPQVIEHDYCHLWV